MKIGLLTYHSACNFGANLQALSTVSYWHNHGYDPVFINWVTNDIEARYKKSTPPLQYEEHERFRTMFFPVTRRCVTDEEVAAVIREEGIEAVVVGSDAVMRTTPLRCRICFPTRHIFSVNKPEIDAMVPNPFWGSFYHLLDHKIPLCFMSASCQNSRYYCSNREEKRIQKELLMQYSYISTRDDWTARQVSWLTDGKINPPITPDPVFAFNYNVVNQPTEQDIRQRFGINGRYCLFCFHSDKPVSKQWLTEMQKRMDERGVECVALPFPRGVEFHHPFDKQIGFPLSPLDWYALIKYADYYIGENMHPIVICLHNAVPCFSFDYYGIVSYRYFVNEKSSKIYHILNQYGHPQNRVSLKGIYHEPSVDFVLEKLDGFNKDKVSKHSEKLLTNYKQMMADIESKIKKS